MCARTIDMRGEKDCRTESISRAASISSRWALIDGAVSAAVAEGVLMVPPGPSAGLLRPRLLSPPPRLRQAWQLWRVATSDPNPQATAHNVDARVSGPAPRTGTVVPCNVGAQQCGSAALLPAARYPLGYWHAALAISSTIG